MIERALWSAAAVALVGVGVASFARPSQAIDALARTQALLTPTWLAPAAPHARPEATHPGVDPRFDPRLPIGLPP